MQAEDYVGAMVGSADASIALHSAQWDHMILTSSSVDDEWDREEAAACLDAKDRTIRLEVEGLMRRRRARDQQRRWC